VYIDHLLSVVTDTWSLCTDPVLLLLCAAMFIQLAFGLDEATFVTAMLGQVA